MTVSTGRLFAQAAIGMLVASQVMTSAATAESHRQQIDDRNNLIIADAVGIQNAKGFELTRGAVLDCCKRQSLVTVDGFTIKLAKGAIALIKANDGTVIVRNLNDRKSRSVIVEEPSGNQISLNVGQELFLSRHPAPYPHDNIGRRAIRSATADHNAWKIAEFCLQDNLVNEPLLEEALAVTRKGAEHQIYDELVKTTAICNMVERTRGPYVRGDYEFNNSSRPPSIADSKRY